EVLLSGGVADALDLAKEDAKTVARYDTASYTRPDGWSKVSRGKAGMYTGHARALGKQLLLARRVWGGGGGVPRGPPRRRRAWGIRAAPPQTRTGGGTGG